MDDREQDQAHHRAEFGDDIARDRFGGLNWGSAFFGWLVAVAMAILLTSIIGAVLAAVDANTEITRSQAEKEAGTIGIASAVVLLLVLLAGYYLGGYVAGRMSRYDGGRQGGGVWAIGIIVTIIAVALGALFGSQYNILDRVDLPSVPITDTELGYGAIITAVAVVVLTLIAAVLGGKAGRRYHDKVDQAAGRQLP